MAVIREHRKGPLTRLVLTQLTVEGDIRSTVFNGTVQQTFRNLEGQHIEVIYPFPLPVGATLLGFRAQMAGKDLVGEVSQKQQAQAVYDDALSDGHAAVLLARTADGNYVLNLGNLAPGETCVVELQYAQVLHFEKGALRLCLPTLIAPRYGDVCADVGLLPHQVPRNSLLARYDFSVKIRLHDALSAGRVSSPSHPIHIERPDNLMRNESGIAIVTLAESAALDRDFVVTIDRLMAQGFATCAPDRVNPQQMAMFASFCPTVDFKHDEPVHLKVLVDASGSMFGPRLLAAQNALRCVLDALSEPDQCSFSKFGARVEHESTTMRQAQSSSVADWRAWVEALEADMGGTRMEHAILETCAIRPAPADGHHKGCDLLLITDGHISAVDRVVRTAKQLNHRVFVVGIGSSPSAQFLQTLASSTHGACEFVTHARFAEAAIKRMFERIRSPNITDLTIVWPPSVRPLWFSVPDRTVFSGDATHLYAWLDAKGQERDTNRAANKNHADVHRTNPVAQSAANNLEVNALSDGFSLVLAGRLHPDQPLIQLARVRLSASVSRPLAALSHRETLSSEDVTQESPTMAKDNLIARLVAAARVQASGDVDELTRLAVDYQLVTANTQFVVVNRRAATNRATDMPYLQIVEQMLPAGHGGLDSRETVQLSMSRDTMRSRTHAASVCNASRPGVSLVTLDERAVGYWIRQTGDGAHHLAVVLADTRFSGYQVMFFKADIGAGRERALIFDVINLKDLDTANLHLADLGFHTVSPDALPGFTHPPTHLQIDPSGLHSVYSVRGTG